MIAAIKIEAVTQELVDKLRNFLSRGYTHVYFEPDNSHDGLELPIESAVLIIQNMISVIK